jgi:hypothetical protein
MENSKKISHKNKINLKQYVALNYTWKHTQLLFHVALIYAWKDTNF